MPSVAGRSHVEPIGAFDERAERSRGLELDARAVARERRLSLHAVQQVAAESLLGERVEQQARIGALPNARERKRRGRPWALWAPVHGERQEIALDASAREPYVDRREQPIAARALPRAPLADRGRVDRLILGREPALLAQVARQHLALELPDQTDRERAPLLGTRFGEARERVEQHEPRRRLGGQKLLVPARRLGGRSELEPVEAVPGQRQQVRQIPDRRKRGPAHELDGYEALVGAEIELDGLRGTLEVRDAEQDLLLVTADIRDDLAVPGPQELERTPAEGLVRVAHRKYAARPVQQRGALARLRLHVDGLVAVDGIHDRRQEQALRVRTGEAAVAVRAPLHRRPYAVAVAEEDVVPHAELVTVIDGRGARHREQQAVHELDLTPVVFHERREAAPNADVDAHTRIRGIGAVHVVPLAVRDHLERELVVIAQEDRPLAVVRNLGRLLHDLDDGVPVFLRDGHVHAGHEREVVGHVALVPLREVLAHVLGPLVRLGQQHAVRVMFVHRGANLLDDVVRLGQVLVGRARAHAQVGDRVEPQPVYAHIEPEPHDADHGFDDLRIVVVQVRLMREEPVPVVLARDRIPGPVRALRIREDDPRLGILLVVVAPDVEVALCRPGRRLPGRLEPRMLIRGVVDDELGDDLEAALMRLLDEGAEVAQRAVDRIDVLVIGNVVAVVAHGRRIERQQPDRIHAEALDVVELLGQPRKIAEAVAVLIEKRFDVHLVDDGVLVPERIAVPGIFLLRHLYMK